MEDQASHLSEAHLDWGEGANPGVGTFDVGMLGAAATPARAHGWPVSTIRDTRRPVLLVRTSTEEGEVLVAGTPVHRLKATAGSRDQVQRAVAVWRDEWLRLQRQSRLPAKLIAFFDDLHLAETPQAICDQVARHAVLAVGGHDARLILFDAAEREGMEPDAVTCAGVPVDPRFSRPGLLMVDDLPRDQEWLRELGPLAGGGGAVMLAHVPFGERGLLFLSERRCDRIFEADDWDLLATVAEQGSRAMDRALWIQRIQDHSLTDPLTRLANRRQMDVVMAHAWAAAQRSDGLAVMMLDLDDFKAINDRYGHQAGDQILCIVADCLRREARGADAVVRYGGDEFLVVMPRATADGARALARRVAAALSGWVGISAGVAEYHSSYQSPEELIHAADSDLYRDKSRSALAPPLESLPPAG